MNRQMHRQRRPRMNTGADGGTGRERAGSAGWSSADSPGTPAAAANDGADAPYRDRKSRVELIRAIEALLEHGRSGPDRRPASDGLAAADDPAAALRRSRGGRSADASQVQPGRGGETAPGAAPVMPAGGVAPAEAAAASAIAGDGPAGAASAGERIYLTRAERQQALRAAAELDRLRAGLQPAAEAAGPPAVPIPLRPALRGTAARRLETMRDRIGSADEQAEAIPPRRILHPGERDKWTRLFYQSLFTIFFALLAGLCIWGYRLIPD